MLQSKRSPFGYSAWGRNPAIVTWAGVGTSGTSLDIYASSSSKFVAFDDSTGAWAENPARTWVSTADSSTIPGYTDTAPFWRAFSYGAAGYVAPGLALRLEAERIPLLPSVRMSSFSRLPRFFSGSSRWGGTASRSTASSSRCRSATICARRSSGTI